MKYALKVFYAQTYLNSSRKHSDSCFVVTFSCHLGHVVYSDQKVKTSEIPSDA